MMAVQGRIIFRGRTRGEGVMMVAKLLGLRLFYRNALAARGCSRGA